MTQYLKPPKQHRIVGGSMLLIAKTMSSLLTPHATAISRSGSRTRRKKLEPPERIPKAFTGAISQYEEGGEAEVDTAESVDQEVEIGVYSPGRIHRSNTLSKQYTEAEEKAVVRKFDRKLVLFLAFLYLLSFLDRSNIGNARVAGLDKALNLSDRQFDYCLIAFYLTYITFEWMILLYQLVPAHIYISLCVLAWGVIASLQSTVTSFEHMLALRACLGVTEAAFGPGVPFYMTFFYHRSELAYRVGLQISAAPLATSLASSVAWAIIKMSQHGPLEPWRAVFLLEGFPSIITAIFAWHFIPDSPETARYLTPREQKVAKLRLVDEQIHEVRQLRADTQLDRPRGFFDRMISSPSFKTLSGPIPWLQALIFFSINVSFASLPVFLPTIIKAMSFSAVTSQILAAPPYLLSFAFVLFIGHLSDTIPDSRGLCLMSCAAASALSYFTIALFGGLESHGYISDRASIIVRYVAIYPAAMGLFSSVVLIITWNLNNQPSRKDRGLAMMVMNVFGQCGPLIGANSYPKTDAPHYIDGMLISGGFMVGVVVLAGLLRWKLKVMNGSQGSRHDFEMVGMRSRPKHSPKSGELAEEAEALIENNGRGTGLSLDTSHVFRYML